MLKRYVAKLKTTGEEGFICHMFLNHGYLHSAQIEFEKDGVIRREEYRWFMFDIIIKEEEL